MWAQLVNRISAIEHINSLMSEETDCGSGSVANASVSVPS